MQAIDSAKSLATDLGTRLCVPWNVNYYCGARFDELFEGSDRIGQFLHFDAEDDVEAFLAGQSSAFVIDHNVQPFCDIPNAEMVSSLGDIQALRNHPTVIIRSWARFYPSQIPFSLFPPLAPLRARIANETRGFDRTVGIHIRRGDHADAISGSPTSAFAPLMREALESGDAADFFLATDDPAEEAELRREFPIRTATKRSLDRSRVEAIQDAVVDLFCLGATKRIIGSAGSTFSFVASQLKGIPFRIAGW